MARLAIAFSFGLAACDRHSPLAPQNADARVATPRRIVSLNPCLDAILVQVADRSQIAALSHFARDPSGSTIASLARTYSFTWGSSEEIAVLRPDLVLLSGTGSPSLAQVLAKLGIASARFAVPSSVQESLDQIDQLARAVGHADRGQALIASIRLALTAASPNRGEPKLTALLYQSYGFAAGPGTLTDELMRRTGFRNLAAHYGLARSGTVPLELLLADPPQVLLAGERSPGEPSWADRVLSHPALGAIATHMRRARFPAALHYCGGPVIIPALQALTKARREAAGDARL